MQVKEMQKIGLVSLGLLALFSLTVILGMGWQLLYLLGLDGSPANLSDLLGRFLGNSKLYFPVIFIFPLIAFMLSLGGLALGAYKSGVREVLTLRFARANWLIAGAALIGAVSILFLSGHDFIPCMLKGFFTGQWQNMLQICAQA